MIGRDPIIDMQTCTEAEFMAWLNGYAERFPEIAAWGVARVPPAFRRSLIRGYGGLLNPLSFGGGSNGVARVPPAFVRPLIRG
jgi:hypothetical protein